MHYLLLYDYVPDIVERRGPHRAAHLAHARAAVDRGELVLGGALANPIDGGVLLFRGDSPAAAEAFAQVDPVRPQRSRHPLAGAGVDNGGRRRRRGRLAAN